MAIAGGWGGGVLYIFEFILQQQKHPCGDALQKTQPQLLRGVLGQEQGSTQDLDVEAGPQWGCERAREGPSDAQVGRARAEDTFYLFKLLGSVGSLWALCCSLGGAIEAYRQTDRQTEKGSRSCQGEGSSGQKPQ